MRSIGFPELIIILLALAIYFLPALVGRHKRNALAIFALNLLLGWTLLGWVGALVWALIKDAPPPTATQPS
jgi:Superinfection immunity protein